MAKRRGHPVGAGFVGFVAVVGAALLGVGAGLAYSGFNGAGNDSPNPVVGAGACVAAAVWLVGGMWCAWRIGSGHWLWRRRMAGERKWHPAAAVLAVLLALGVGFCVVVFGAEW